MMLSYRAWLRVGPQHVNEWSIASKAGSQDHLRLELWYPSSPDVRTEKCGAESWWGNTPGGQNRINLDDKNADASCHWLLRHVLLSKVDFNACGTKFNVLQGTWGKDRGPSWGPTTTLDSLQHYFPVWHTLPSWCIFIKTPEGFPVCITFLSRREWLGWPAELSLTAESLDSSEEDNGVSKDRCWSNLGMPG